ncbi:MAG: methyltransferase domain-containing protein [bacterium]|nr:methyltransferase domain-containing protein [bacterium]
MNNMADFPGELSADWCNRFFNHSDYLDIYRDMTGPDRTESELGFCHRVFGWKPGDLILDAPCGAGRHTLPLSREGHQVIGLDISSYLLASASADRDFDESSRQNPRFVQGVIQRIPFLGGTFQYIINLFSSFGYLDTEEDNLEVMKEYYRVLKPGGMILIDIMNRHFIVPRLNRVYESVQNGLAVREERVIVDNGRRMHNRITVTDSKGSIRKYLYRPWLYNGWELSYLAANAGFSINQVYGDFKGNPYHLKSERAMLVATKTS